jgi:predicted transcriptional regulator
MHKSRWLLIEVVMTMVILATVESTLAATRNPFVTPIGWEGLLQDVAVQKELMLSDDQAAKIKQVINRLSGKPDLTEQAIRKLIIGEQITRIEQLDWQREGGYALFDPKISKTLSISEKQQGQLAEVATVNAAEHKKMRDFMSRARFRSREAMAQYVDGFHKPANKRLLDVLSKDQQGKLKTMLGKPITNNGASEKTEE